MQISEADSAHLTLRKMLWWSSVDVSHDVFRQSWTIHDSVLEFKCQVAIIQIGQCRCRCIKRKFFHSLYQFAVSKYVVSTVH